MFVAPRDRRLRRRKISLALLEAVVKHGRSSSAWWWWCSSPAARRTRSYCYPACLHPLQRRGADNTLDYLAVPAAFSSSGSRFQISLGQARLWQDSMEELSQSAVAAI